MSVKTSGFKELNEALDELSRSAGRGAAKRALNDAAKPLVEMIKQITPVDEGHLKASITSSDKLDPVSAKGHRNVKSGAEVFVGPSYNLGAGGRHGHLVEFGTVHSNPRPFLRPAWEADQKAIIERIGKSLMLEIEKSVERAARKAARLRAK